MSLMYSRVEIEPVSLPVKQVRKGRLLVALPQKDRERLPYEKVEETQQALRAERASLCPIVAPPISRS